MKITQIIINLLSFIHFVFSFKLNNTFFHGSYFFIGLVCDVKIYYASNSVDFLASGSGDGRVKIWYKRRARALKFILIFTIYVFL